MDWFQIILQGNRMIVANEHDERTAAGLIEQYGIDALEHTEKQLAVGQSY